MHKKPIRDRVRHLLDKGFNPHQIQEILYEEFGRLYRVSTIQMYNRKGWQDIGEKHIREQEYMEQIKDRDIKPVCDHKNTIFEMDGLYCDDCGEKLD